MYHNLLMTALFDDV